MTTEPGEIIASDPDSAQRLYDVPSYGGDDDYIPDTGLDAMERVILTNLPNGFDVPSVNATSKGVTATVHFDGGNPITNADHFDAVMRSATVIRTLHANLVAARKALVAERADIERIIGG